jgi:nitroreductase
MFQSLIEKRRSIRKFTDKTVEPETLEKLVEALLRSPSSRGINPWEFVMVSDKDTLEKLARSKPHGSSFVGGAALCLVVCGDSEKSDVWIEDTSIATIFTHLAAADLGLGSCWIQIRERPHNDTTSAEAYIQELLNIPAGLKILSLVAIGYPDEEKPPHAKDELLYDRVHYDSYGNTKSV